MTQKELIQTAFALGKEAFYENIHIPAFNKKLMALMPKEISKVGTKILKSYYKGYTIELLK